MTRQSTHTLTRFGNWPRHTLTRLRICMQSRNRVRDIAYFTKGRICIIAAVLIIPAFGYGQTCPSGTAKEAAQALLDRPETRRVVCKMAKAGTFTMNGGISGTVFIDQGPDDAVWNYHPEISYDHFRFGSPHFPMQHPLIIIAGYTTGAEPKFNPHWQGLLLDRMIVTRNWWIPYPTQWQLTDNGIAWVIAGHGMMWKGLPLYYQFDFNADGHVNASDLAFFESEYGAKWNLSDFSSMGLIYNARRRDE